jgi:hypothetical protein
LIEENFQLKANITKLESTLQETQDKLAYSEAMVVELKDKNLKISEEFEKNQQAGMDQSMFAQKTMASQLQEIKTDFEVELARIKGEKKKLEDGFAEFWGSVNEFLISNNLAEDEVDESGAIEIMQMIIQNYQTLFMQHSKACKKNIYLEKTVKTLKKRKDTLIKKNRLNQSCAYTDMQSVVNGGTRVSARSEAEFLLNSQQFIPATLLEKLNKRPSVFVGDRSPQAYMGEGQSQDLHSPIKNLKVLVPGKEKDDLLEGISQDIMSGKYLITDDKDKSVNPRILHIVDYMHSQNNIVSSKEKPSILVTPKGASCKDIKSPKKNVIFQDNHGNFIYEPRVDTNVSGAKSDMHINRGYKKSNTFGGAGYGATENFSESTRSPAGRHGRQTIHIPALRLTGDFTGSGQKYDKSPYG